MACVLHFCFNICFTVTGLAFPVASFVANDYERLNDNLDGIFKHISDMELRLAIVERKLVDTANELDRQREINERQEFKIKNQAEWIRSLIEATDHDASNQNPDVDRELTAKLGGQLDTEKSSRVNSSIRQRSPNEYLEVAESRNCTVRENNQQVAFSTYLTSRKRGLGSRQTLIFDGVILNDGNAYNKITGIFTTPVSGVYLISFACEDDLDHRIWTDILVNGRIISTILESGSSHAMGSNTVIVRLTTGQSVWVAPNAYSTDNSFQNGATTFSGVLLYVN